MGCCNSKRVEPTKQTTDKASTKSTGGTPKATSGDAIPAASSPTPFSPNASSTSLLNTSVCRGHSAAVEVNIKMRCEDTLGVEWEGTPHCIIAAALQEGYPAMTAGMEPGWQVLKICDAQINDQEGLEEALAKVKSGDLDSARFLMIPTYTRAEVAQHNKSGDCWVIIDHHEVYDVSNTEHETDLLPSAGTVCAAKDLSKKAQRGIHIGNIRPDALNVRS